MFVRSMAVAVGLLAAAAWPCMAEPLDIKIGLWETTPAATDATAAAARGLMTLSDDQLAKLTPEQRAALQQRMAAASAAKQRPHKFCVTELNRQKGIGGARSESKCTRTVVSSSAQGMEIKLECDGSMTAKGTVKVSVVDSGTMNVATDMTFSRDGQDQSMHLNTQSHWVSSDCGDVKPIE